MSAIMAGIEDYLEKYHKVVRAFSPNVLNVWVGTKIVNGVDTKEPCVTIVVKKKIDASLLSASELIPKILSGFKTDVIELAPQGWVAGKTTVSELSPKDQKRMLGAILKPKKPRATEGIRITSSYNVDLRPQCTLVRDQGSCGSCTTLGSEDCFQDVLNITTGIAYVFSIEQLFECSGGTCNNGNTVEATLDYMVNPGVALDQDCAYVSYGGTDYPCDYGLASDWYLRGKKLDSWSSTTDTGAMKATLSANTPLVTTMDVHQSFMNYVSGIYSSQGILDPVVGGHCIECVGVNDASNYWIIKNSWTTGWGLAGYCMIKQGDSNIDSEMYTVVPSSSPPNPTPPPPPPPSPCPYGRGISRGISKIPILRSSKTLARAMNAIPVTLSWKTGLRWRKGRFYTMNNKFVYLNPA